MRKLVAAVAVLVLGVCVHAAECSHCSLPFAEGTITCWGCGSHLPGAPKPQEVLKLDLGRIQILVDESALRTAGAAAPSPEVALEAIESFIRKNPKEFDEAVKRLEEFLPSVSGTVLDRTVMRRIREIKAAGVEANKPKSQQERLKEAALAYTDVMGKIRKEPGRTVRNIRLLENLLEICRGTPYENLVEKQLKRERAK